MGSIFGSTSRKNKELIEAVLMENISAVKACLASGADINASTDGFTPLQVAAANGLLEVVEYLISKGANVNGRGEGGLTPLHMVAYSEPYLATSFAHREIAELLISKGADVNAKCKGNSTPLDGTAMNGYKELAELLISKGSDVNTKNSDNTTPLHLAVGYGHRDVAELLISKGADVNIKNNNGFTPLQIAILPGQCHQDIIDLLKRHGGRE